MNNKEHLKTNGTNYGRHVGWGRCKYLKTMQQTTRGNVALSKLLEIKEEF
jgi:hypothetical protein